MWLRLHTKTIVAGFKKVGKQVENMSKDLGRWMGAIQAVKEGHNKKKIAMFGSCRRRGTRNICYEEESYSNGE